MTKLVLLFSLMLASLNGLATVPTAALTFDTDVRLIDATSSQAAKIEAALDVIKRVIGSEEFRTAVLNHTYGGTRRFVDNDGYTNSQIYTKMLEGAEVLNKIKDNAMDLEVEFYYASTNTVGYTYSNSKRIYVNTKFFNSYTPAQVARNLTHKWLHKLGFSHAVNYSTSRDYSVPYGIGSIMERLGSNPDIGSNTGSTITPATNLSLAKSGTSVTLKWTAAKSSAGISQYKIYRILSGSTTAYLQGTTTTSLSFTQTAPTKSAQYYVKAVDRNNNTVNSSKVSYSPTVALGPVTGLTLSTTTSSVILRWTAAPGAVSYKIYRRLSGSTTNYLQKTTTSLSYTQSRPSSSAVYYVRSVDASGKTLKSVEVSYRR